MKSCWPKLLLLVTFAFWASGAAKFAHESLEHHGRDASVDDDDDDVHSAVPRLTSSHAPTNQQDPSQSPAKPKAPCPVCQMLAAMMVDRSAPPAAAPQSTLHVETLNLVNQLAPAPQARFALPARGPPLAMI